MRFGARVGVILPAYNEEAAIGKVLASIPSWIDHVVVVDNASTDATPQIAREHGARVEFEPRRGYGAACLKGIAALKELVPPPDIIVFLDADASDDPAQMHALVDPLATENADLALATRTVDAETGAIPAHARWGNRLACTLLRWFWAGTFTDLGPFRAIRSFALDALNMADQNWGWTIEMQIRALQHELRIIEVPMSYAKRVGKSKISGTVRGTMAAGTKILYTVGREFAVHPRRLPPLPRQRAVLFTRYPTPGEAKTRLIPALGAEGAAQLHARLALHAAETLRQLHLCSSTHVEVQYDGGPIEQVRAWLGRDLACRAQAEGDLGARMLAALVQSRHDGMERTVLLGTDCPALTRSHLESAFDALESHDAVIGPATDGGYYLIGLRRPHRELFERMPWGTDQVLEETRSRLKTLGLCWTELEPLDDVDRPEDLQKFAAVEWPLGDSSALRAHNEAPPSTATPDARQPSAWQSEPSALEPALQRTAMAPGDSQLSDCAASISVIIPVWNEAEKLPGAIASARLGANVEVVVADGGSTDGTADLARRYGARIVQAPRGRAAQMNAGAAAAGGELLLFLHADTRLMAGYDREVRQLLSRDDLALGAFRLAIDAHPRIYRVIERAARFRSAWLGMPYGDQALFLRAETFHTLGGYPELPILEDYELVRRTRRHGCLHIARLPARTSARRWRSRGPLRVSAIHLTILLGYWLGVPLPLLCRMRNQPAHRQEDDPRENCP